MKKINRKGFYVRLNDNESRVVYELKNKYAINISGAFKVFLFKYLEHLNKLDIRFKDKER